MHGIQWTFKECVCFQSVATLTIWVWNYMITKKVAVKFAAFYAHTGHDNIEFPSAESKIMIGFGDVPI